MARRDVPGDVIDTVAKALRSRRTGRAPARRRRAPRACAARGRPRRAPHRREAALRGVPGPAGARRGAARGRTARLLRRVRARRSSTAFGTSCSSTPRRRSRSSRIPEKPSLLVPDGCEVHTLALGIDDVALALEQLADARRRGRERCAAPARGATRAADRRAERAGGRRGARRAAARRRDRRRRSADRRAVRVRRDRGCARATTG